LESAAGSVRFIRITLVMCFHLIYVEDRRKLDANVA
jgi:hypothetical protein